MEGRGRTWGTLAGCRPSASVNAAGSMGSPGCPEIGSSGPRRLRSKNPFRPKRLRSAPGRPTPDGSTGWTSPIGRTTRPSTTSGPRSISTASSPPSTGRSSGGTSGSSTAGVSRRGSPTLPSSWRNTPSRPRGSCSVSAAGGRSASSRSRSRRMRERSNALCCASEAATSGSMVTSVCCSRRSSSRCLRDALSCAIGSPEAAASRSARARCSSASGSSWSCSLL